MLGSILGGHILRFEIGFQVLRKETISNPNAKAMAKLLSPDQDSLQITCAR